MFFLYHLWRKLYIEIKIARRLCWQWEITILFYFCLCRRFTVSIFTYTCMHFQYLQSKKNSLYSAVMSKGEYDAHIWMTYLWSHEAPKAKNNLYLNSDPFKYKRDIHLTLIANKYLVLSFNCWSDMVMICPQYKRQKEECQRKREDCHQREVLHRTHPS